MYSFSYFRDIKAGNILLNAEGHAKLADFGVAGQLTVSVPKITSICIFTWREHLSEVWAFLGHLIYPLYNLEQNKSNIVTYPSPFSEAQLVCNCISLYIFLEGGLNVELLFLTELINVKSRNIFSWLFIHLFLMFIGY